MTKHAWASGLSVPSFFFFFCPPVKHSVGGYFVKRTDCLAWEQGFALLPLVFYYLWRLSHYYSNTFPTILSCNSFFLSVTEASTLSRLSVPVSNSFFSSSVYKKKEGGRGGGQFAFVWQLCMCLAIPIMTEERLWQACWGEKQSKQLCSLEFISTFKGLLTADDAAVFDTSCISNSSIDSVRAGSNRLTGLCTVERLTFVAGPTAVMTTILMYRTVYRVHPDGNKIENLENVKPLHHCRKKNRKCQNSQSS